jgi:hypothetical protein
VRHSARGIEKAKQSWQAPFTIVTAVDCAETQRTKASRPSSPQKLTCDMRRDCTRTVTHIDNKGFVYCTSHGENRRTNGTPCRKMRPSEIEKLESGQTIRYR